MQGFRNFTYPSCNGGEICAYRWEPIGSVRAVVQLVHGLSEYSARYDAFAQFLSSQGFLVVSEDHMGHGRTASLSGERGCFTGGWKAVVADTYQLLEITRQENPDVPYFLFGHSMGSFIARTILIDHPDCAIAGCILCGTTWQNEGLLDAGIRLCKRLCNKGKERLHSKFLMGLVFGPYSRRIEHLRTPLDWINRDPRVVQACISDPDYVLELTVGLITDMLEGIFYIQQEENLERMNPSIPVYFISGGDDPVGDYAEGVRKAANVFREMNFLDVAVKIYPLCRHEILHELNKSDVYADIFKWLKLHMTF